MNKTANLTGALLLVFAVSGATSGAAYAFNVAGAPLEKLRQNTINTAGETNRVNTDKPSPLLTQTTAENTFRMNELQEQVRRLNGKVEELTFQLLQLQEQIRKMQEDTEFRFQELEEKHSDNGKSGKNNKAATTNLSNDEDNRLGKPQPPEDTQNSASSGGKHTSRPIREARKILGAPARDLGTLRFDDNGNVIESAVGKPLNLTAPFGNTSVRSNSEEGQGSDVNDLEPGLMLARGRDFFDAGDYVMAERTLRLLISEQAEHENRPEAQYWLGRSLFARGDFHTAATVFLDTHNAYPDTRRAPDTLLRLGLAMAGLNHREIACATYSEVLKQYPGASQSVKSQVDIERTSAGC